MSNLIPAHRRQQVYAVFAVVGVILGATQVGYAAAEQSQPVWLTVALAVFGFLSGAVGYVAASNVALPDENA